MFWHQWLIFKTGLLTNSAYFQEFGVSTYIFYYNGVFDIERLYPERFGLHYVTCVISLAFTTASRYCTLTSSRFYADFTLEYI